MYCAIGTCWWCKLKLHQSGGRGGKNRKSIIKTRKDIWKKHEAGIEQRLERAHRGEHQSRADGGRRHGSDPMGLAGEAWELTDGGGAGGDPGRAQRMTDQGDINSPGAGCRRPV